MDPADPIFVCWAWLFQGASRIVILVLESVIRGGWCVINGSGSCSHEGVGTDDGGGSVGISLGPVMCFCDHCSSNAMATCSVGLPICASLLLTSSSSCIVSGNPAWAVVNHTDWSSVDCWKVMALRSSPGLRMMVSSLPVPIRLGSAEVHRWPCCISSGFSFPNLFSHTRHS